MSRSSHRLLATALFTIGPLAGAAFGQGLVAPPTPTVTVSSETASTSQYGIKAIDGVVDGWPGDYTKEWATFGQLAGAWIKLSWTSPVQISRVILYDRPNLTDQVLAGNLTFSDGSSVSVGTLPNAAQGLLVSFAAKTVTWLQFTVTKAQGQNIGLAEIQFYGPSSQTPSGVIAKTLKGQSCSRLLAPDGGLPC